jgi:hypothetical protein
MTGDGIDTPCAHTHLGPRDIQGEVVAFGAVLQEGLRQRWSRVRAMGVAADHDDLAVVPEIAQGHGGRRGSRASADDDDAPREFRQCRTRRTCRAERVRSRRVPPAV